MSVNSLEPRASPTCLGAKKISVLTRFLGLQMRGRDQIGSIDAFLGKNQGCSRDR
jgi:hypothetical protein